MMRGIDGREIFRSQQDRDDLLGRLCRILPESGMGCFAWAFMTNHVHLVLRTGSLPVGHVLRRVNTGYAVRFNKLLERRGYVFQDRFRSRPVVSDEELLVVARYVHRNPLAGGLVASLRELEAYPWSGYPALLGRRSPLDFEEPGVVLSLHGSEPCEARRELRRWMMEASPGPPDAIAPTEEAVEAVAPDPLLVALLAEVAEALGVDPEEVLGPHRRRSLSAARAAVAYLACRRQVASQAEVARLLGLTQSAVSQAVGRGAAIASRVGLKRVGPRRPET